MHERTPVGQEIHQGARLDSLFRIGASLRGQGLDEAVIRVELRRINQERCQPPVSNWHVDQIAKRVTRYAPGK